jgi:hypothetical protein
LSSPGDHRGGVIAATRIEDRSEIHGQRRMCRPVTSMSARSTLIANRLNVEGC